MCIRDSQDQRVMVVRDEVKVVSVTKGGKRESYNCTPQCNPVSYTHLRAHETVLDLVCRLLLEKKKTPHQPLPEHTTTSS